MASSQRWWHNLQWNAFIEYFNDIENEYTKRFASREENGQILL